MVDLTARMLSKLLNQQAVVERDVAQDDPYGGESAPDWQPHLTVPCLLWWDRSSGVRSANREYVTATRQVPLSQGGMLLPSGTDITQEDRVTQVNQFNAQTGEWMLMIDGLLIVTAVLNEFSHMEIDVMRAQLGA